MTLEKRVRAAMAEERRVVERSLGHLRERQYALEGVTDALARHPGKGDFVDAAPLGLQATVARADFFQDHLRRLGSSDEYERRMESAVMAKADADAVGRARGGVHLEDSDGEE
jgi:excinuclease UvrABC helicase subunit UvrB